MSGDFRQCLPIIKRAGRGHIVRNTLKQSEVWKTGNVKFSFEKILWHFEVKQLKLRINERVNRGEGSLDWSNYLLEIGNGTEQENDNGFITIPPEIMADSNNMEDFIQEIYPYIGK